MKIDEMTDEEMRVKIAELVNDTGLTVCRRCWSFIDLECCGCGDAMKSHTGHEGHSPAPMGCRCGYATQPQPQSVPDYLNDLNAMHEAEKTLATEREIEAYLEALTDTSGGASPVGKPSFTAYFASARQRAIAFMKTKLA